MDDKPEEKRYWERSSGTTSSRLMFGFIIVVIVMLVVISAVAVNGYMRYRELIARPEIHVERGLFDFHREGEEDTVNITAQITLVNKGRADSGQLELEYFVMPADLASQNIFISHDRIAVDNIGVDESTQVYLDLALPVGNYRMVYRSYEDGLFSYEARQSLRVLEDDIPEADVDEDHRSDAFDSPFVSAPTLLFLIIVAALIWWKKGDKGISKDESALTGPEAFILFFIILLLLLTVVMAVMIDRMGPQDEPHFNIEDVFYQENEDSFTSHLYITNQGTPSGTAIVEWMVTRDGDRLVDSGEIKIAVSGRTTECIIFDFDVELGHVNNVEIFVTHDGNKVSTYNGRIST